MEADKAPHTPVGPGRPSDVENRNLADEPLPPRDEGLSKETMVARLREAYLSAAKGEPLVFDPPLDVSLLISTYGLTQKTLPLPGGGIIGRQCGIGLPKQCSAARVEQMEEAGDAPGVWVTFSALDKGAIRHSSKVLMLPGETGLDAIKTEQDVQAEALKALYEKVAAGAVTLSVPLDVSLLISGYGQTQMTLPLPGGGAIGKTCTTGVPNPCSAAQVEQMEEAGDARGVWVTFSALDKDGVRHSSKVLLLRGKIGEDAIRTEQDVQADALKALYELASAEGINLESPLDVSLLIAKSGKTRRTLPLPSGGTIGRECGIGLPKPCSTAQVERAEEAGDKSGVWVTFSALDKRGERLSSRVLLLRGKMGLDAIKTEQDIQADALKALYEQAAAGFVTLESPLDVSLLIGNSGQTQQTFPLPGGGIIGKSCGLGLPSSSSAAQVEHMEAAGDASGVWVTFSALNKDRIRQHSKVLLLRDKTGLNAIKTQQDVQADALKALYGQAAAGVVTLESPLDVSLLIGSNGTTQMTLPLPGGGLIGETCGIGLPKPCSGAQVERTEEADDASGVWVTFSALDKQGKRQSSKVLLLRDKTGRDAIKTEQDVQADALNTLYEQAAVGVVTLESPLDVSLLISSYGVTQMTLPLPGGGTIGKRLGIGLPRNIASCNLTDIVHLADDRYRLTLVGVTTGGTTASTHMVVSSTGIIRPVATEPGVEIAKGYALDRYVAHLFAVSDTRGTTAPHYSGSALIGECFMPNIVSGDTIVHSKWGNSGPDVFEYVQRYARLRLWNTALSGAVHLLAATTHVDELKAALVALQEHVPAPSTIITDLVTWGAHTLGIDSADINDELERLNTMASIGDLQWLSARTYSPTLPSGSHSFEQTSLPWQERVTALARLPEVVDELRTHKQHHSLYWERSYHIELVRHCSYLLDQALPASHISDTLKEEARQIIYDLYPALKRYPDAWRQLEEVGTQAFEAQEGEGAAPYLLPFDLERELERCGATPCSSATTEEVDWGHVHDVGPKVHDLFQRHPSIEAALRHVKLALQSYSEDTRAHVSRECIDWIAAAVLDVRIQHLLPDSLLHAKGASDQSTAFLKQLAKLPSHRTLSYMSGGQQLTITAQELRDQIKGL